ncbi:MAG TPA: glycoside hydrolase family 9 protein [Lacunisphaera sp.]|nr:glycoside hydrolase family 9 protein [Lacunisphaera sp.]
MAGLLACAFFAAPVRAGARDPAEAGATLRVLAPDLLEIELIQAKPPGPDGGKAWNFATPSAALKIPGPGQFAVTAGGQPVPVAAVGLKRRAVSAPLVGGELRVGTWIYLRLGRDIPEGAAVAVTNPAGELWPGGTAFQAQADSLRESPAIHVNQEGYLPGAPKKAMVGYFLGSMGEMPIPAANRFYVVDARGATVLEGKLTARPDRGYAYEPTPYQQVAEADFTALRTPGEYRLAVPGLGASLPFRIDDGVAMAFARTYALGIYHQRCGTSNAVPFTRFLHEGCHLAAAQVPVPAAEFPSVWERLAASARAETASAAGNGLALTSEAAQLYPFVHRGTVNVAGGHHDAGDYGKYTTNSASFIHTLMFAVDAIPGAAECDNLGLPESGDGVPDLMQEAKWEADFLARMQDDDGGFYFLVGPRDRAYESDVLPDQGDPQVVWPKNTAATAAAVAALAQAASSPHFRKAYPKIADGYLARARKGWKFLVAAIERFGPRGSYQRLTHYGDNHRHDDELAWAAAELFLATGEGEFHDKFRAWCDPAGDRTRRWGWWRLNECWGNAIRSYAFAGRTDRIAADRLDAALLAKCEREIEAAGRDAMNSSDESAYGTSFPAQTKRMRGGGWYFSLDQAFDLAVASLLDYPRQADPRPQFLEAYLANLNFEAGTNPVNISYLTGLGQRRPHELVHQYAENDRRREPPPGLPIGNIQAGQPYLSRYKGELGNLSFPDDGAATAPYPYYDRWTDTHNVSTEFVIVNQARALAGLVWLAAGTEASRRPWRPVAAEIKGLPEKIAVGRNVTVRLVAPAGLDLTPAKVEWEAAGGASGQGSEFTFSPGEHGRQWVEAGAQWPDGRRIFAVAGVEADNGRPVVTIRATQATASVPQGTLGAVEFHRTGDNARPLVVHFSLGGTAGKWSDYRRPEGDMPVEMTIPAGQENVTMRLRPMAEGLGGSTREVVIKVKPDESYNVGTAREAKVTLIGR